MISATQFLERLNDLMAQDLLETPDEQIIAEAIEDGIDIDAEASRIKKIITNAIDRAGYGVINGEDDD